MSSSYSIIFLVQLYSVTLNVHCTLHYTSIVNVTFLFTVNDELHIVIFNVLFVQIKSLVMCTFMHIYIVTGNVEESFIFHDVYHKYWVKLLNK